MIESKAHDMNEAISIAVLPYPGNSSLCNGDVGRCQNRAILFVERRLTNIRVTDSKRPQLCPGSGFGI